MSSGETGKKLADMIKHAIDDSKITTTEYERILMVANEDGHIDAQEQRLLANLQEMISNGTVKRIPG
ncbi:MAG TPA: hypothetical protein PKX12_16460 [Spirochaetota bacterium]|nr:hypothetical protein [Spirochaetota bacterium]